VVVCLERGADSLHMVQLIPLPPQTPSSLASFKSRLALTFWYRLTQLVGQLEKRPSNGCSSSSGFTDDEVTFAHNGQNRRREKGAYYKTAA